MKHAYIGTVESLAKANDIAKRHSGIIISGIDDKGKKSLRNGTRRRVDNVYY